MLIYIILAEICLTVGAPNWVVTLCWVGLGIEVLRTIAQVIIKSVQDDRDFDDKVEALLKNRDNYRTERVFPEGMEIMKKD